MVDANGQRTSLTDPVHFQVMIFSNENPPKPINFNTSGDKILKGTVQAQGSSTVYFRKIAIKEVTSHFRNGSFFFVVMPIDASYIKPFIVENFVVKARKVATEESLRKKAKIEEITV